MEKKETVLRVKDLRISFRTVSGKVQAVRNVSFNLTKGETLAIVGESGSGKSVSTRAVLGILAKNAIVESGEILYDGKDILKLSEWDLHKIRGEKIAMIFQDPLSSLNPIVRIGRQMTEASVLKARSNRRENKAILQSIFKNIEKSAANDPKAEAFFKEWKEVEKRRSELALPYEYSRRFLIDAKKNLEEVIFAIEKGLDTDLTLHLLELLRLIPKCYNKHLLTKEKAITESLIAIGAKAYPIYFKSKFMKRKQDAFLPFQEDAKFLLERVNEALAKIKPNFLGLALSEVRGLSLEKKGEKEIETLLKEECDSFLKNITPLLEKALEESAKESAKASEAAIPELQKALDVYHNQEPKKSEFIATWKKLVPFVTKTIDPLTLEKDSYSFTFAASLKKACLTFFSAKKTNAKEEARFKRESERYEERKAKSKPLSFKPVPANVIDPERLEKNVTGILENLIAIYSARVKSFEMGAPLSLFEEVEKHSDLSKKKHTRFMAKMVALRLMQEVGIPEPRKRFRQYPFEFSGGMRQRIVIAIALTGDPEILICDEPTTALDVTIQAQILELINTIKRERNLSVIFITHNLGVVANMADKIAVMYAGKIVEYGTSNDIFYDPKHPYTWALLSSMPDLETKEKLDAIPGTPPNMIYPPVGDAYAARNKYALKIDFRKEPPLYRVNPTHFARTWLLSEEAPSVIPPEIVLRRIERMKERYGKEIVPEMEAELGWPLDEAYGPESVPASSKKAMTLDAAALLKELKKGE